MSNSHVHPAMLEKLAPFIPLEKPHRAFAVKIALREQTHELNILARSSIAAITQAVELLAIDDDCPADGIAIDCRPASAAFVDSVAVPK